MADIASWDEVFEAVDKAKSSSDAEPDSWDDVFSTVQEVESGFDPEYLEELKTAEAVAQLGVTSAPLGTAEWATAAKIAPEHRRAVLERSAELFKERGPMKDAGVAKRTAVAIAQGGVDLAMPVAGFFAPEELQLTPDQEAFRQALIATREGNDPSLSDGWVASTVQQAARMAPPMLMMGAAGRAAGAVGETAGLGARGVSLAHGAGVTAAAYPMAQDQSYRSLIAEGINPEIAAPMSRISGVLEGVIETIIPDPFKSESGVLKGQVRQIVKQAIGRFGVQAGRIGLESFEEGSQAFAGEAVAEIARAIDEKIPNKGLGEAFSAAAEESLGSIGPLSVVMGPSMIRSAVGTARNTAARPGAYQAALERRDYAQYRRELARSAGQTGSTETEVSADNAFDVPPAAPGQQAEDGAVAVPSEQSQQLESLQEMRSKGFISEEDAKKAGIEGKSRKERLANADKKIEELKQVLASAPATGQAPPDLPSAPPPLPATSPATPAAQTAAPPPLPPGTPPALPQDTPKPTVAPEAKVEPPRPQAAQEKEPASPEWDVIQAPYRTGRSKLYREDPNPNLTPSQRRATRQEVDPSEVVLITKDFQGKPIPKETMDARKEFVDKAKPGTTFRRPNFNKNALFEVGKDGKISSIESNSKRPAGSVQELANIISPGDITEITEPSAGPSEGSSGSPTVSPDAPATPETSKGKAAGEGQSSEASVENTKVKKGWQPSPPSDVSIIESPDLKLETSRREKKDPQFPIDAGSPVTVYRRGSNGKEEMQAGVVEDFADHMPGNIKVRLSDGSLVTPLLVDVGPARDLTTPPKPKPATTPEAIADNTDDLRKMLTDVNAEITKQGRVVDDRLLSRKRELERLLKEPAAADEKAEFPSEDEIYSNPKVFDTEAERFKRDIERKGAARGAEGETVKVVADPVNDGKYGLVITDSDGNRKTLNAPTKGWTLEEAQKKAQTQGGFHPSYRPKEIAPELETDADTGKKQEPESKWQSETRAKLESVPALKGAKVEADEKTGTAKVTRSDGLEFVFHLNHDEELAQAAKSKGRDPKSIHGWYIRKSGEKVGRIYIRSDADFTNIASHELFHGLEDLGVVTKKEVEDLGGREEAATKFGKWAALKNRSESSDIGKMFKRIRDFLEPLLSAQSRFFEDVSKRGVAKPEKPKPTEKIPVASANVRIQQLQDTFSLTHEQAVAADTLFDAVSLPGEVEIAPPGTPTPEDRLTQKQLAKESKQHLADESPTTYRELSSSEIPTQTQRAFKLIKRYKSRPGLLYPLFVGASEGGFRKGKWYAAEVKQPRIGSKDLARRPGIHAVDLPIFAQGKPAAKGQDRVWVEVEMPAVSPETQKESDQSTVLSNGMRTGITSRLIGTKEAYDYKTNPNAQGANAWPIAGSMKIVRVLSDSDVEDVLRKAGKGEWIGRSLSGESVEAAADWNSLYQKQLDQQGAIQAWTTFVSASKAIIGATDKADVSSFFHEFGHPMRRFLFDRSVPQEKRGNITDEDIRTIEDFVGVKNGQWNTDAEEKFVDAHMTYLMEGKAPTKKLETVFQKIAKWLSDVLSVIERKVSLSPDVRAVFDKVYKRGVASDTKKPQPQKPDLSTIVDKTDAESEQSEFDDAALKAKSEVKPGDDYRNYFTEDAVAKAEKESGSYKSRQHLIYMSPDEFLQMAERIEEAVPSKQETVEGVLSKSSKFDSIPFLAFEHDGKGQAKVVGHEGRHRAMSLKERGVTRMPVMLHSQGKDAIRWSEQGNLKNLDRISGEWPQVLEGETEGEIPFPVADPAHTAEIVDLTRTKTTISVEAKPLADEPKQSEGDSTATAEQSEFDDAALKALDAILGAESPAPETKPKATGQKAPTKASSGQYVLPGMPGMAAEVDRQDFVRRHRDDALGRLWGWSDSPADAQEIQGAIDTLSSSVASLMSAIYAGDAKTRNDVYATKEYHNLSAEAAKIDNEPIPESVVLGHVDIAISKALDSRPKPRTLKKPRNSEQTMAEAKSDLQVAHDAAAKLMEKIRSKLMSGVDPELMAETVQVAYLYTKAGIKTFKGYVEAVVESFGDSFAREFAPYMESGWRALYTRNVVTDPAGKVNDYLTEVSDERDTGPTRDVDGASGARTEALEASEAEASGIANTERPPDAGDGGSGGLAGDGGRSEVTGDESPGGTERSDEDVRLPAGPGGNYRIGADERVGGGAGRGFSAKARFTENVKAIRLLKTLEKEGRKATAEEQSVLVKYVGWGGLKQAFGRGKLVDGKTVYQPIKGYESEFTQLRDLLTDEEWQSAKKSITNAHYTDPAVIRGMWQGLEALGFKGGKIVEPSAGTGLFFGHIPQAILDNPSTRLAATEIDSVSGRIAQQLYQGADVRVQGFEELNLPDNSVDLFISNVPFGRNQLSDKKDRSIKKAPIHNFFFNKAIRKTRPGGLVAFITSRYSMDEKDASTREFWDKSGANLVGVVRLPGGAFKGIANTDVVTDIIILQKREDGAGPVHAAPWKKRKNVPQTGYVELVRRKDGPGKIKVRNEGDTAFPVNEYFEAHPENIVGELAWTGTMQKVDENQVNVEAPETGDIGDRVNEIIADLPVNKESLDRVAVMTEEIDNADMEAIKSGEWQDDHLRVEEGRIFLNHFGNRVEVPMPYGRHKKGKDGEIIEIVPNEKGAERMTAIIKVFNAAERLIALQPTNASDKQIEAARLKLNKVYDAAVKKFGPLSSGWNATFSRTSLTVASRVFSLEEYNPTTDTAQKAAIFTERTERPHTFPTKAENAQDALTISLSQVGSLDPSHTANLLGKPVDSTMEELGNLVFKNHDGEWELASTYLSGNVRKKLAEAKALAEDNDSYRRNVESLEAVQPEDLTPSQIEVRLGSPWIPTDVYEQFLAHLLRREVKVSHSQAGGKWFLTPESRARNDQLETLDWGIARMPALDIITKSLNRGDMRVWEPDGHGGRVVNRDDTTQVAAKLTKIKAEFGRWIWDNPERVDRLTGLYNQEVNNIHQEPRDGSHLTFPGMSEDVRSKLDAHQVNAVWRYLTGGNMLLAHVVGAGKSWVMAASAMEQKRISGNPSYKTMIAVPNHLVTSGQFVKEIYEAYPSAKVLAATPDSLSGIGRRSLLKKMATGNYDIVVIAHSSFGKIPLNPTHEADFIQKQIDDLEVEVRTARADSDRSYEAELQAMIDNLRDKLSDMSAALQRDELSTYFDELNIDSLFVDEAHEFKNLAFRTRMSRVPGVNPTGSNMAFDMWMKTTYFNKATNEKNLMFATGTPIANAIAEMYTMQRYLQPSELARLGLEHFDSWAAAFADEVTKPEIDPAGGGMRMHSRLAQYINMPELSAIFRQVADVQTADMLVDVLKRPAIKGGSPQAVKAERNAILEEIIEGLQERAQRVRGGMVDKSEDNMLNIVTDGRKAATDIRLINPSYPDLKGSKVNLAVENIHRIWEDTSDKKSTQIVWLDVTSPNTDYPFNLYHEIVDKLAALGIPRDEIAIMHDYNEKTKSQLFRSMNKGDVRILLGSTAVMGTGVNVQKRLIASHHLDVPWRPDQLEQRDGRILRRGNTNKEVEIIRYISKGSFDSFMWDKIEQKSSFIRAAMSGASDRILDASEAEDMSAAEMKAAAADDPNLIRFVTVQAEVNKLESEHRGFLDQQSQIRQGIATAHRNVEFYTQRASNFESMIEAQESLDIPEGEVRAKIGNTSFTDSKEFGKALTDALVNAGKEDVYFEYNGFKGATHKIGEGWIDKSLRSVGWLGSQATNVDLELSDSPTGNITRLNNAIAKIKGQPEYYRDQVEQNRLKIPALEKRIQAGWPDADKLSELRQEQATLAGLVQSSGSDEHKQEIARRIEQQTARKVLISGETGQYLWEGVEVATDKSKNAAQNEAVAVVPPNIVDAAEGQLTAERNRDREARLRKLREEAELYEWDRTVSPRPPKKKTTRKKSTNPAASSAGAVGESRSLDAFTSPDLQNRQSMGAARRRVESAADLVGDDTGASDSRYASSDSEFEQRWQRAAKGISKQSLAGKLREFWQELVKSTVRGSLPELPRTEQFGEARSAMHAYQNAPTYAQIATADLLKKTSKPLSASDYDLFTRVVIMRDQVEAASKGERLSYGLTPEKAQAELDRVEALAADNERVQASLEYRKQWTEAMVNDFLAAHEYLGLDMSDRFKRENYFRHQVLYYAEAKQRGLGKKKVELTPNRGWLKGRTSGEDLGEAFDINANYLQAEWEVSTQMIADTKRAQAIGRLKRHYDKMRQLKEKAKYDNYVAVVGGPENMQEIEELRGKIDELRAMGSLDSGEKAQIKAWSERIWELDPTMEFRQRMAIARDQIERGAAGLGEDASGDFMRYVSSLAKRDDSPLQPPALEFLKAVSDRKKFIKNALGDKYETWEDVVPDDHEEVAIRPGRAMFQAYSVPEQVASELMADLSKTLGISAEDLRPLTALGSKYTPLVVPQEVAAQMAAIDTTMDFGWLDHMVTRPMNAWKRLALMGPTRFIKYNLRNLSEIDKVMSLNPAALKDIPQAIRDLWKLYSGADNIPASVRDWAERGGTSTLVRVNELGELNELKAFARLISDKRSGVAGKVIKAPVGAWRTYWSAVGMGSDFRESILRYAAYLNYVKQLEAGKLTNYGGSVRAEVDGIKDIKDKAMRLSSDLLGDYSDISQVGQFIRSRIAPFWSFQETNVRTYTRGLINLASNEQTAIKAGMAVARAAGIGGLAKTPFLAYKLGRIAILFYGFKALTTAFNQMLFPDDDDELTDEEKRKAHLTFGKNSKGEVQYFSRIGTAADVLDWVGLDSVDYDLRDVLDGRRTIRDVLNDMARSPVDKAYGMLSPFMKVPTELAVGQTAYPSVGKPRPIRDRGRYIAQNLGLQKEYDKLVGNPTTPYSATDFFLYKVEPGTAAYYMTLDAKFRWLKTARNRGVGYSESARGNALRNYKMAQRLKDQVAVDKYLAEYEAAGGTKDGLMKSLEWGHPAGGLSTIDAFLFYKSLAPVEQDEYRKAEMFYYSELLTEEQAKAIRATRDRRLRSLATGKNKDGTPKGKPVRQSGETATAYRERLREWQEQRTIAQEAMKSFANASE